MEFKVSTDLAVFNQPILFNAEELKAELSERLDHYNNLVVTEDAIRDAKADRATLNQLRTAMENKRKEIKSQCETPYAAFKSQYDQVLALIDKPIAAIDGQIKAFDEKRREEKLTEITEFWNQNIGKYADYVSFRQVFNAKWLNATYKMSDINNEIMGAMLKVEDDLKSIRELHSDFEIEALNEYAASNNLNSAIGKIRTLEERRKSEQARAAMATPKPFEEAAPQSKVAEKPVCANTSEVHTQPQEERLMVIDFRIHATKEQLSALKSFLVSNNIRYGKVPKEG